MVGRPRHLDDYEQLVREHQVIAFRTAYVITGSAADAEEVVQDAFVKAYRARGRFREGAPFRPWLLAIVANEARNRRRSLARRARFELHTVEERPSADAAPSPEAALLVREQRAQLLAAIDTLGEEQRQAVACRYLLGLSEQRDGIRARVPPRHGQVAAVARAREAGGGAVSELEARLSELVVEWPEAPDVAPRVRARLEARPRRRLWPRIAIPVAVLALVAAVPPARSTVLDWLGLDGVKIERVPKAPTPAPSIRRWTSAIACHSRARSSSPASSARPTPSTAPPATSSRSCTARAAACRSPRTRGAGALLTQLPGRTNEIYIRKFAGPDTTIERVTVDGEPGFWLAGVSHGVLYEHSSGDVREAPSRLAGNTLIWQRGAVTLRLEADITKERALAIARSVE